MTEPKKNDLVDRVLKLINKRPDYAEILRRAVTIENNPPSDFVAKYGWEWDQVHAHPGTLTKMIAEGILKVGYKSRRYKHYQLVDKAAIEKALEILDTMQV